MLYGELGRTPPKLINDQRIIGFGAHRVQGNATKMSDLLLIYLIRDSSENGDSYNWLEQFII